MLRFHPFLFFLLSRHLSLPLSLHHLHPYQTPPPRLTCRAWQPPATSTGASTLTRSAGTLTPAPTATAWLARRCAPLCPAPPRPRPATSPSPRRAAAVLYAQVWSKHTCMELCGKKHLKHMRVVHQGPYRAHLGSRSSAMQLWQWTTPLKCSGAPQTSRTQAVYSKWVIAR